MPPSTVSLSIPNHSTEILLTFDSFLSFPQVGEIKEWCGTKFFADLIIEGLEYLNQPSEDLVMVYECPSSNNAATTFQNMNNYIIHDYPPTPIAYSMTLRPIRYSFMNGDSAPAFLAGDVPDALQNHWCSTVPGYKKPTYYSDIPANAKVHAYLPIEGYQNNVHDPDVHYHIAGKAAINEMTERTTRLYPDTKTVRPCIAKSTHAMGSLGIFVIRNDEDEAKFFEFIESSGNQDYIVTELVDIHQNLACHFFMHPNGDVIWIGSSENLRREDGSFTSDSCFEAKNQDKYRELMAPFVRDVAQYCLSKGHWGFAGIDVLVDSNGKGYNVDVNPRVTGSMPAIMAGKLLNRSDLTVGKFRKATSSAYRGTCDELMAKIEDYNAKNSSETMIVVCSLMESTPIKTYCNMAVFGKTNEACEAVFDMFLEPL
jgi:hypothetical protein